MGHFYDIARQHMDTFGVREAALARRMEVSAQTLNSWKNRGVKKLPERTALEALARETRTAYEVVLTAALVDTGYLDDGGGTRGNTAPMNPGDCCTIG